LMEMEGPTGVPPKHDGGMGAGAGSVINQEIVEQLSRIADALEAKDQKEKAASTS